MGKRARIWLPPGDLPPGSTPILGEEAKRQIREIKTDNRRLARRLTRKIVDLVDEGRLRFAESIPDRSGIGPRFLVDLLEDYVAVYWVVIPKHRNMPVIWVEQVKQRAKLEAELAALAPEEPEEES